MNDKNGHCRQLKNECGLVDQPILLKLALVRLALSLCIGGFLAFEAAASSKRQSRISQKPVEFAQLFYLINGKNIKYTKCLQRASKGEFMLRDCKEVLKDIRSFASGFDYDSQHMTEPNTACRVLEALAHLINGEDPHEPTRCNE